MPIPQPILAYCQLKTQEQILWKLQSKCKNFHSGKLVTLVENVLSKMAAILSQAHCVNSLWPNDAIW